MTASTCSLQPSRAADLIPSLPSLAARSHPGVPPPTEARRHRLNGYVVLERHVLVAVRFREHRISNGLYDPVALVRSGDTADTARAESREPAVDQVRLRHRPHPSAGRGKRPRCTYPPSPPCDRPDSPVTTPGQHHRERDNLGPSIRGDEVRADQRYRIGGLHQVAHPPAFFPAARDQRQAVAVRGEPLHPQPHAGVGRIHPHKAIPRRGEPVLDDSQVLTCGTGAPIRVYGGRHVHVKGQPGCVEDPPGRIAVIRRVGHIGWTNLKERAHAARPSLVAASVPGPASRTMPSGPRASSS